MFKWPIFGLNPMNMYSAHRIIITERAKQVNVLKYPCTAPSIVHSSALWIIHIDKSRDYTFSFTQRHY